MGVRDALRNPAALRRNRSESNLDLPTDRYRHGPAPALRTTRAENFRK
jgi:hypothetical protein